MIIEEDKRGFDIVIGNPPYFQLREIDERLQNEYKASKYFKFAKGGRLNVFQFFVPLAIQLSKKDGIICLITQNSLLGEDTALGNRKYILGNTEIIRFHSFPERDNVKKRVFESAKMSVAITLLRRRKVVENTFEILVWKERAMIQKTKLRLSRKDVSELFPENLIFPITSQENISLLQQIKNIPNASYLDCSAGEVDMTKFQPKFNQEGLGIRVYTGAQIHRYSVTENPSQGKVIYLQEKDFPNSGKFRLRKGERIAMQRITGVDSAIRLIMTILPKNSLCANSLNFVVNDNPIVLRFFLGVLNSKLINQYYKWTSTNTNITTTEINRIPIPKVEDRIMRIIANLASYLLFLANEDNKPILAHTSNPGIAATFEEVLNMAVYELYFPNHMQERQLDIIQHLQQLPHYNEIVEAPAILEAYLWLQQPNNTVRNKIISVNIKSPDLISQINASAF